MKHCTSRSDKGSAGNQFVLLFAVYFVYDPYTFIDSYDSAVQTKIIVLRIAKLLPGIVLIMRGSFLIRFFYLRQCDVLDDFILVKESLVIGRETVPYVYGKACNRPPTPVSSGFSK